MSATQATSNAPSGGPSEDYTGPRVNGFAVMVLVVLVGLASGAAYYHYKQPQVAAKLQAELDAAPSTSEGRVEQWRRSCTSMIHHRLSDVARISAEHPWLVTHRIEDPAGGPPAVWGIDCSALPRELTRLEGLTVIVDLPAPRLLGHVRLGEEAADYVPTLAPGVADEGYPARQLERLARHFLGGLPDALASDIPGASVEVRVGEG